MKAVGRPETKDGWLGGVGSWNRDSVFTGGIPALLVEQTNEHG